MKTKNTNRVVGVVFLLLVALAALLLPSQVKGQGQAGTTISAEKTATGFWEKIIEYDWSIQKAVEPTDVAIKPGASSRVTYTLTATRTKLPQTDRFGVRGQVCVTNGGERATENLKIVDRVQYKTGAGKFQNRPGATQTIIPAQQLDPGETRCYPYEITFMPVPGAVYRNVAKVTITNHSGHLGEEFGPEPEADFWLPGSPTITYVDAEAHVTDKEYCPAGFTCTPSDPGPWDFTNTGSVSFTKEIHDATAQCDTFFQLNNDATLVEKDTHQSRTNSATVNIHTPPCVVVVTFKFNLSGGSCLLYTEIDGYGNVPNNGTAEFPAGAQIEMRANVCGCYSDWSSYVVPAGGGTVTWSSSPTYTQP